MNNDTSADQAKPELNLGYNKFRYVRIVHNLKQWNQSDISCFDSQLKDDGSSSTLNQSDTNCFDSLTEDGACELFLTNIPVPNCQLPQYSKWSDLHKD